MVKPEAKLGGSDEQPKQAQDTLIQSVGFGQPFRWLMLGWQEFRSHIGIGLFYGLCFWMMAITIGFIFQRSPAYTMSAVSGCLLLGPLLAMGLYDVSRQNERSQQVSLARSVLCWDQHISSLGLFALVLLVLELLWGRASLVIFAIFFNTEMPSTAGVIEAVFNPENLEFVVAYITVGCIFAVLVYSTSVVSIPMILDQNTDAVSACLTSIRTVLTLPLIMLFWALLIVSLTGLAIFVGWGLPLIVVGPVLGHASWHAYRALVNFVPKSPKPADGL